MKLKMNVAVLIFGLYMSGIVCADTVPTTPPAQSEIGPISYEPTVEKNGVRVALKTAIKHHQMSVLVKISNFSDQPVLVSPDLIQATTEEGFVIAPAGKSAASYKLDGEDTWNKVSKLTAAIPFSTPYKVVSSAHNLVKFADQTYTEIQQKSAAKSGTARLKEVILQPGMATNGMMVYDASFKNAYTEPPLVHITVTLNGEPYEFKFLSR